jgi:hypothetical protein
MTDDPIKAALDVLTQAIMDAVEGECDGLAITPQQARAIGAYGVAAFLRAMNPHGRRAGFNLAADVEEAVARAAQEARE